MDIKELESGVNPNIHWYYQSKKLPFERYVSEVVKQVGHPITLIDIGSGSGFFMYEIEKDYPHLFHKALLVDIEYSDIEIASSKDTKFEKMRTLPTVIENSVIVMMDVLEHLESDIAMLNEIKHRCVETNYFFITVPAFKSIWSGHDIYLGHYRRYTKETLKTLLENAGYSIQKIHYLYGLIFPFAWLYRRFQKNRMEPKSHMGKSRLFTNIVLKIWNSFEMKIARINNYFGLSCSAYGKIKN